MSGPIYIRERIQIPRAQINKKRLIAGFEKKHYDENSCAKCDFLPERHCGECEGCPAFLGTIRMWREAEVKGKAYVEVPAGDIPGVEAKLNLSLRKAIDKRARPTFKHPLKWTGKLRSGEPDAHGHPTANQVQIFNDFMKAGANGLIEAPPRTGKTVLGVRISCKLGLKTLIIAHQEDLLHNFYKTYLRDTNLKALRKKTGKKIVAIVNSLEEVVGLDVALITYQKFIRSKTGVPRIRKYLKGKFGFLVVDEVHQAAATAYSRFVNNIDPLHRLGLTATPRRKDRMHYIVRHTMGPVKVRATATALKPQVYLWETEVKPPRSSGYSTWTGAISFISKHEKRNQEIVKRLFKKLREGHKGALITVDRRQHVMALVNMINKQAAINRLKRKEKWPKIMAAPFFNGVDRKKLLRNIDKGEHLVLVCIRQMMKQGIDLVRPSYMPIPIPTSNPAMFYQLVNRICTPGPGKKAPEVDLMIDRMAQSSGCFRSVFTKEIFPKLKARAGDQPRYLMDKKTLDRAWEIVKDRGYHKMSTYTQRRSVQGW